MFRFVIVVLALLSGQIWANETVRVTGRGPTPELARYDGYLQAVQRVSGSAILSQKEFKDRYQVKDSLTVYSAGYQKNINIIDTSFVNGEYFITMDIVIASSHLSRGLLGQSESSQYIDSDIHQDQIDTYLESRSQGDQLLESILNDFPQRAFTVTQGKAEINVINGDQIMLRLPYSMMWNSEFISAFESAIVLLSDKKVEYHYTQTGYPTVGGEICIERNYSPYKKQCQTRYNFNDNRRVNLIKQGMGQNRQPAVRIVLFDKLQNIVDDRCHIVPVVGRQPFYNYGKNTSIRLFYSDLVNTSVILQLRSVKNIDRVDMFVVAKSECKNWYNN
jgi:hypothetical protein